MVEILRQLVKFEISRDTIHRPRFRVEFKSAKQNFPCVFLVVGTFVRHAQHGHLCEARDRLGHDIEVFAGM